MRPDGVLDKAAQKIGEAIKSAESLYLLGLKDGAVAALVVCIFLLLVFRKRT